MEDDLHPTHGVVDTLVASELSLDDLDVDPVEIPPAPRGEVVEHADVVAALEQCAHQVGADEAAAPCDECFHRGVSARTWKFAKRLPGPGSRRRADRPSIPMATRVDAGDERPRGQPEADAAESEVEIHREEHSEAGRGARGRRHPNRRPGPVLGEELLEPSVRPAPVVGRGRVVRHHAVRRGEHAAARRGDAVQLRHRLQGVVAVLEHLVAEDDVEGRVLDGEILDRPFQVRLRVVDRIHADVRRRVRCEERLVWPRAATDVEDAIAADRAARIERLLAQPADEWLAHGVGRHRSRGIESRVSHWLPSPSPHRRPRGRGGDTSRPAAGSPGRCRATTTRRPG